MVATAEMKTTYAGVEITYHERENKWQFILRGRERSAESLKAAKEAIDKPVKVKSEFEPVEAWYTWHHDTPKKVKVTSIAEKSGWSGNTYLWINKDGQRSKEPASRLYADTEANALRIKKMIALDRQREVIDAQHDALSEELEKFVVPNDEEK